MTDEGDRLKSQQSKARLVRGMGGLLGGLIGFGASKVSGYDSLLPWLSLGVGGAFLGTVLGSILAQKLTRR